MWRSLQLNIIRIILKLSYALGETLLKSRSRVHFLKQGVGLIESSKTEVCQTNLDDGSVVVDPVHLLLLVYYLLELTPEHQIARLFDSVVDCVVVNLQENGSNLLLFTTIEAYLIHKILDHIARWLIHEVDVLHFLGTLFQDLFCIFIQGVVLVVDVLQFENRNPRNLILIISLSKESHHFINKLQKQALVLESKQVLNI